MNTLRTTILLLASLFLAATGRGVPPHVINYQGRLTDGTNVVQGAVQLRLSLFNQAVGGAAVYRDTGTVTAVDGLYATVLGDGTESGDLSQALTNEALFLEVEVNGIPLAPRERLASVPYALQATETDPLWTALSTGYYTRVQSDALYATGLPLHVESDPVFTSSVAASITAAQTDRWETAFGWGNHATAGYLTNVVEVDPVWTGASNLYYLRLEADARFATGTPLYVESDTAFTSSVAATITAAQTDRWEAAFGWGNHATAGYLTNVVEVDPTWTGASNLYYLRLEADARFATGTPLYVESDTAFTSSVAASITPAQTDRWEAAFGWGNHATAGYLTNVVEVDPIWAGASNLYYLRLEADARFATGTPLYVESDTAFTSSVAATITAAQTDRWEAAFGWGNHATAGYLTNVVEVDPTWTGASNLYYLRLEADARFATGTPLYVESDTAFTSSVAATITAAQTDRWETAFGWGNHAAAGYLTNVVEVDPIWAGASNLYYLRLEADARFATGTPLYVESDTAFTSSVAATITAAQTDRWETAFGWGNHATAGYLTNVVEVDPIWAGASNLYYLRLEADARFATGTPLYVESDTAFTSSVAATITAAQTDRWETAFGWGNHATVGYLTNVVEVDPVWTGASNLYYLRLEADARFATGTPLYVESDTAFTSSVAASITAAQTDRWETAFGWGNHATAGYLTNVVEVDPLWAVASNAYYTKTQSLALFSTGTPVYAESDPKWTGASNLYYTKTAANGLFATGTPLYVETDATALLTNGLRAMGGNLNMGGRSITNIADNGLLFTNGVSVGARFVDVTGDIMTGKLFLPTGGLQVGAAQFIVLTNGNVGIGTANPTNTLAVNGSIKAKEVIVTSSNWPDYVFAPDYRLRTLGETERFIAEHGHLPDLPAAGSIERDGVPLGELGAALLRKIEELTLHQIALERENQRLRSEVDRLSAGGAAGK